MSYIDARLGPWCQTLTGGVFHYENPGAEDIDIRDIAAGLSNICRFGGQLEKHYSVADHSILVSQLVAPEHKLQALLHDAPEAYLGDIPTPLKGLLGKAYSDLEEKAWAAVAERFGVPVELHQSVKDADAAVLRWEARLLFPKTQELWGLRGAEPQTGTLRMPFILEPRFAKERFLAFFEEIAP